MGQYFGLENIPSLQKASNTSMTLASTNLGQATLIRIGGQTYTLTSTLTCNTGTVGAGGIDVGPLASNQLYYCYLIVSNNLPSLIISLAGPSTGPAGFTSNFRLLGKLRTDFGAANINTVAMDRSVVPQRNDVEEWQSYTPTTGAMGTSPTVTGLYRRVGDSMEINFRATLGTTPGAGTKTFDLPSGFTIDFAKLTTASARSGGIYPNTVGSGAYYAVSTENVYPANIQVNSDDNNTFYFAGNGNGSNWSSGNTPVTPAANDRMSAFITIPIAEWAGLYT